MQLQITSKPPSNPVTTMLTNQTTQSSFLPKQQSLNTNLNQPSPSLNHNTKQITPILGKHKGLCQIPPMSPDAFAHRSSIPWIVSVV
jgi:hypothetical protein